MPPKMPSNMIKKERDSQLAGDFLLRLQIHWTKNTVKNLRIFILITSYQRLENFRLGEQI
jgi:hypothetical protein